MAEQAALGSWHQAQAERGCFPLPQPVSAISQWPSLGAPGLA